MDQDADTLELAIELACLAHRGQRYLAVTRPQWILPHGGTMTGDGTESQVFADYA